MNSQLSHKTQLNHDKCIKIIRFSKFYSIGAFFYFSIFCNFRDLFCGFKRYSVRLGQVESWFWILILSKIMRWRNHTNYRWLMSPFKVASLWRRTICSSFQFCGSSLSAHFARSLALLGFLNSADDAKCKSITILSTRYQQVSRVYTLHNKYSRAYLDQLQTVHYDHILRLCMITPAITTSTPHHYLYQWKVKSDVFLDDNFLQLASPWRRETMLR